MPLKRLKCANSMSGCCREAGRQFQILGPATEKLLTPSRVFVLGTVRTLAWAERSWGRRGPQSAGAWPRSDSVKRNLRQRPLPGIQRVQTQVAVKHNEKPYHARRFNATRPACAGSWLICTDPFKGASNNDDSMNHENSYSNLPHAAAIYNVLTGNVHIDNDRIT